MAGYDPKQIARLNQIIGQVPGIKLLWLTGLEHAPWFENATGQAPAALLDRHEQPDTIQLLDDHLRTHNVEGDFLLHLNDISQTPWARVTLDRDRIWLSHLLQHTRDLSLVSPAYTLRLDIRIQPDACALYINQHTPFDLDTPED